MKIFLRVWGMSLIICGMVLIPIYLMLSSDPNSKLNNSTAVHGRQPFYDGEADFPIESMYIKVWIPKMTRYGHIVVEDGTDCYYRATLYTGFVIIDRRKYSYDRCNTKIKYYIGEFGQ